MLARRLIRNPFPASRTENRQGAGTCLSALNHVATPEFKPFSCLKRRFGDPDGTRTDDLCFDSAAPKRSPFGAPDFTPLVARVDRTPLSERSTAKLKALAWRPSGSCHRTCQRAHDLGIAIPSTTERLWPALKFQDFLRLSQGSDHYFTTSLGKRTKSRQLSREKLEDY